MDWIVAVVLGVAGVVGIIGLYLGLQDPVTRHYKPKISGLFWIGRSWRSPDYDRMRDTAQRRSTTTT